MPSKTDHPNPAPKVALVSEFTLPVYYDGGAREDEERGLVEVMIDGVPYVTEGYIFCEPEHRLSGCVWFEADVYLAPDGHSQPNPLARRSLSGYDNTEDEALASAIRWQQDMAEESGLIFPIYVRI